MITAALKTSQYTAHLPGIPKELQSSRQMETLVEEDQGARRTRERGQVHSLQLPQLPSTVNPDSHTTSARVGGRFNKSEHIVL